MVNFQPNLFLCVYIFAVLMETFVVIGKPQVPCYFIFGDSLFDSGNNNQLLTTLKSNYPPYGTDFPQGVTGRFTNGRTVADIIGQLLGFDEYIPTYATATDQHISQGVNYASGGSGIREETGSHLGGRISLDRQLLNHHSLVSQLFHLQRNITFTREYLSKCIYLVNMGSNDYINNYLKPKHYTTSHIYTTRQYAKILVRQYSRQLKSLYDLGGRKIVVFGLGLIGCAPEEISTFGTGGKPCVQSINDAIRVFNRKLKPIVDRLNVYKPDAKFTFINLTGMVLQQDDIQIGYDIQIVYGDNHPYDGMEHLPTYVALGSNIYNLDRIDNKIGILPFRQINEIIGERQLRKHNGEDAKKLTQIIGKKDYINDSMKCK